jgi:hypothetical protein
MHTSPPSLPPRASLPRSPPVSSVSSGDVGLSVSASVSVSRQLEACDGPRLLVGLLTSPSASINLAGAKPRVSGGLTELRMTASVQGMSTKQVSW